MNDLSAELKKIILGLKADVSSLRTGRATPALVEDLAVEAYGGRQILKTLAAISIPEPRHILIQPWDRTLVPAIEKAIQVSSLGVQPIADKDSIRLALPTLTEERKGELVRVLKEKMESSRIQIRRMRDEAMKEIEVQEKSKQISEDERFRKKQEVENVVSEYNKKIEELGAVKEKEIAVG